jgi:hypothetical protein
MFEGHYVIFIDHMPKNNKKMGFVIGSQNKKVPVVLALFASISKNKQRTKV